MLKTVLYPVDLCLSGLEETTWKVMGFTDTVIINGISENTIQSCMKTMLCPFSQYVCLIAFENGIGFCRQEIGNEEERRGLVAAS